MRTGIVVLILLAILITTSFSGCGGNASQPAIQPADNGQAEQSELVLPEITALKAVTGAPVSQRYGSAYSNLLPSSNVQVDETRLEFVPGESVTEPAFAFFYLNTGEDTTKSNLNFQWQSPGDYSQAWLGLANFETGNWDWLLFPETDRFLHSFINLDEQSSCYVNDGEIWFVILCYTTPWELELVCFDNADVIDILNVGNRYGYVNQTIALGASYGDLLPVAYQWEFGSFAAPSASTEATPEITLLETGTHTGRLTATAANGASASRDFEVTVYSEFPGWISTFKPSITDGSNCYAAFRDSAIVPSGNCYLVGATEHYDGWDNEIHWGLIAKYTTEGDFQWARGWHYNYYAGNTTLVSVAVDDQENIYALGSYSSHPYIISYTSDGAFRWASYAYDIEDFTPAEIRVNSAGNLIVVGTDNTTWEEPDYLVFLEYDQSGTFIAGKQWGCDIDEMEFTSMCQDGSGNLFIAGYQQVPNSTCKCNTLLDAA